MSPAVAHAGRDRQAPPATERRAAAGIRARELYFLSLAAFRNNLLDAAAGTLTESDALKIAGSGRGML
jgi:hypothetical protein